MAGLGCARRTDRSLLLGRDRSPARSRRSWRGASAALRECCALALERDGESAALQAKIGRAIEPFDVIGLSDAARRNWYPVLAEDLLDSGRKLGANPEEIEDLLWRLNAYSEPASRGRRFPSSAGPARGFRPHTSQKAR